MRTGSSHSPYSCSSRSPSAGTDPALWPLEVMNRISPKKVRPRWLRDHISLLGRRPEGSVSVTVRLSEITEAETHRSGADEKWNRSRSLFADNSTAQGANGLAKRASISSTSNLQTVWTIFRADGRAIDADQAYILVMNEHDGTGWRILWPAASAQNNCMTLFYNLTGIYQGLAFLQS